MDEERWVDVKGYEGLYQVSTHGRVYSVPRQGTRGGMLSQHFGNNGYLHVMLNKDGVCRPKNVHRLVAENLIDNPDNHPQVNHKDECKTNNHASNLEWCTAKYNTNYGTGIARMVAANDYAALRKKAVANTDYSVIGKKLSKPVLQYDLDGNFIRRWDGVTAAAAGIGHAGGNISSACNGRLPHAYGYIWRHEEAVNA